MPYKDKQKQKEYNKKYNEKNKEQIKEKRKEQRKEYYEQNKEKIKEYKKEYLKEYFQTDQGKKAHKISKWKQSGLICEDYDKLYEHYINTNECDNCGIELVEGNYGSNKKCMDHSHRTGLFRNILCNKCNIMRPHYESD